MKGIIYKATNKVNGKIYIGQTTKTLNHRKGNHIRDSKYGNGYAFHNSISKYGELNFEWEVIDYYYTKEEMVDKERYWIKYYNSYIHSENSNGYNLTIGGEGTVGRKMNDFQILNNRELQNNKSVIQFSKLGTIINEFNSLSDASRHLNISHSAISRACTGIENHCLGFLWMFSDDYNKESLIQKVDNYKLIESKQVIVVNKDLKVVGIYSSVAECSKKIKGDHSVIRRCCINKCKGVNKSHKGFKYYYYDDFLIEGEKLWLNI